MKLNLNVSLFLVLFIISTFYVFYQHSIAYSWDFSTYLLNAKYYSGENSYYEPYRPPLASFMLSLFSIFGWTLAEYFFMFFSSVLFAFSCFLLSRVLLFSPLFFYCLSLTFFVLHYGFLAGTELFSFSLLQITVYFILKSDSFSGFFLGLAALSRYTNISLLFLLFFLKNPLKIFNSFILFFISWFPWLLYNKINYGNSLMSVADGYAMNVYFRWYTVLPVVWHNIFELFLFLAPFFILGLLYSIYDYKNENKLELFLFLFLAFISFYNYVSIPIKISRYLFNFSLPLIYFSYKGIGFFSRKFQNPQLVFKKTVFILFFLNLSALFFMNFNIIESISGNYEENRVYDNAVLDLSVLGKSNCSVMSNSWVIMNYLGVVSKEFPREELLDYHLQNTETFVFFKHIGEPLYIYDAEIIKKLPVLIDNPGYMIIGNKSACAPTLPSQSTYINYVDNQMYLIRGYHIKKDPCFYLFEKYVFLQTMCDYF